MVIDQLVDTMRPYATSAGYGTLIGATGFGVIAMARGLRRGTTFVDQLRNGWNQLAGVGLGVASAVLVHNSSTSANTLEHALQYLGAATVGAVAGSIANPVVNALATTDSIVDRFGTRMRQGALRGAIAFPLGYGALDLMSRYF